MNGSPVSLPPMAPATTITATSSSLPDPNFCTNFKLVGNAYKRIHGYTSLTVCIFGVLANTLNLIVLTRKDMINSTNAILTGLALADLFKMVEYVPFAIYMNFLPDEDGTERKTYPWAVYVLVHSNFSQVCHTISIWLTLNLAVWRYIMISMPLKCKTLCSMERSKWLIASAYLFSPFLCLPIYFAFSISAITPSSVLTTTVSTEVKNATMNVSDLLLENVNATSSSIVDLDSFNNFTMTFSTESPSSLDRPLEAKYVVNFSALAKKYPLLLTANFWFYSVVLKLLPCLMLSIVSFRLINSLLEAKKRKEKILGVHIEGLPVVTGSRTKGNLNVVPSLPPPPVDDGNSSTGNGSRSGSFTRPTGEMCVTTRTTRMLLAVLLLFLITEFPQGILALLSDLMGDKFFKECYYPLSDLFDFLAITNSAITFCLYCSMSTQFKNQLLTLCETYRCHRLRYRQSSIASNVNNMIDVGGFANSERERIVLHNSISAQVTDRDNDKSGSSSV